MKNNIRQLTKAEFPPPFREIPQPPKTLWIEGGLPPAEYTYLTVVGSRRFSTYGREVCETLIEGLSGQPVVIVSGLAIGIDTVAHTAALRAKLKTIAIPGSGLDRSVLHPPSNRRLADQIIEAGGTLLSELAPTEPAGIHTFPRRNRLMAGLARGVLIIEAGSKSGTLITARLATEYNRDVYAVPGSIFAPNSIGTNNLIRQGATPITSASELLEALGFAVPDQLARQLDLSELSDTEKKVVQLLMVEGLPRDDLIRALGLPPQEMNPLLTMMEIKGLIKELAGEFRLF